MSGPDQWANHLDPAADPELRRQVAEDLPENELAALDRISEVLSEESVWAEPSPGLRERLLLEATAESEAATGNTESAERAESDAQPEQPTLRSVSSNGELNPARPSKRSRRTMWIGSTVVAAAAALVLFFGFAGDLANDATSFELAGTELSPDLEATADVEPLPAGVAITLNIKGLPAAGEGQYYAAWVMEDGMSDGSMSEDEMSDDEMSDNEMADGAMSDMASTMVGVGSFHWREGGIPIELWSGVDTDRYPIFMVTLQNEGEPSIASDVVVITGRLSDQ